VTAQLESLNIGQMKTDFNDFYERIKRVEAEMLQTMHDCKIMYQEVAAGFTKNARDRSDYNNDYERMSAMAESSVNTFREQMNEFQLKLEKLNYCILSIVNEDEAA